jgi:cellulose synthase/poly-beta-1,6-N-acetylglucosamine synthase-like glycosyltransferase
MMQIVIGTIIAFLSVAGIAELARGVKDFFYLPAREKITFMVSSRGHDERIEYVLRSLVLKARELSLKMLPVIIVVDEGMDEETKLICEKLSVEYGCIQIYPPKVLAKMLCGEKI